MWKTNAENVNQLNQSSVKNVNENSYYIIKIPNLGSHLLFPSTSLYWNDLIPFLYPTVFPVYLLRQCLPTSPIFGTECFGWRRNWRSTCSVYRLSLSTRRQLNWHWRTSFQNELIPFLLNCLHAWFRSEMYKPRFKRRTVDAFNHWIQSVDVSAMSKTNFRLNPSSSELFESELFVQTRRAIRLLFAGPSRARTGPGS